jgi:hypothetical protein
MEHKGTFVFTIYRILEKLASRGANERAHTIK